MEFNYKFNIVLVFWSFFCLSGNEVGPLVFTRPENIIVRFSDDQGRILEGGGTNALPLFVRRFTTKRRLDNSFAENGVFYGYDSTSLTGRLTDKAKAWSFSIDEDGNIYVGGTQGGELLLIKLDDQGQLVTDPRGVTKFKRDGLATISVGYPITNIRQIGIDKDNIYITSATESRRFASPGGYIMITLDLNGIVKEIKTFIDEKGAADS